MADKKTTPVKNLPAKKIPGGKSEQVKGGIRRD